MFTRALALATIALTQTALAQCDEWLPTPGSSLLIPSSDQIMCTADHDGPGPRLQTLYATGAINGSSPLGVSGLMAWDSQKWSPVTYNWTPTALHVLKEPAAGLPAGTLILGGRVYSTEPDATRFFSIWDGQNWTSLGPSDRAGYQGINNVLQISSITTWDADGPGPQQALIVAAGSFTHVGGVHSERVAAWNGSQWIGIPSGSLGAKVTSFDPDGLGPLLPLLISGNRAWNGTSWQVFGPVGAYHTFATHDPDGDGPLPSELYAGGNFSNLNPPLPSVIKWTGTGTTWVSAGTGLPINSSETAFDLQSIDLDGPGPNPKQLLIARASQPPAILNNGAWSSLPVPNGSFNSIGRSIALIDPDADGPRGPELLAGGSTNNGFLNANYSGPIAWNGQRWAPLGSEFIGGIVYDFAWNDDDGDGPNPPQLYAGGSFRFAGGQPADGLARWDGARWIGLGTPTAETRNVFRLDSFDPDGQGPQSPWLIGINSNAQVPMSTMRWNGTAWTYVDQFYAAYQTMALRSFDADGPGPATPQLFVGGRQVRTLNTLSGTIAAFSTGPRFSITSINQFPAYTLFPHDADGSGPLASRLHTFVSNGGSAYIYRSDGSSWSFLTGADYYNQNYIPDAMSWDPDGDGPALPSVVVGAAQIESGFGPAVLEAKTARQLGFNAAFPTVVRRLASFDPDGPGPFNPQLLMGYGTGNGKGIKRLVGDTWADLGAGLTTATSGSDPLLNYASAFVSIDPDNEGPLPPELWIGGSFTHANGQPAACFARWRLTGALPVITQQPVSDAPCSNTPTTFAVAADNAQTYQWRISDATSPMSWRALTDGPVIIAGRYMGTAQGAQSATLTFTPAAELATAFTCVVSSPCGAVITSPASLSTIATCCGAADYNHDGEAGSTQDIEAFFACLGGRCCDTCDSIDFDANGDYGTDADIEAFFRVLAGGNC